MYYQPKLSVKSNARNPETIPRDPVEAYKAGYLDASEAMYGAFDNFVSSLKVTGWSDKDILMALMTALKNYTIGAGVQSTTTDIMRIYSGRERNKQTYGTTSKTQKL